MLILEDDAKLEPNFVPAMRELFEVLDRMDRRKIEWDVVFLGYINPVRKHRVWVPGSERPGPNAMCTCTDTCLIIFCFGCISNQTDRLL